MPFVGDELVDGLPLPLHEHGGRVVLELVLLVLEDGVHQAAQDLRGWLILGADAGHEVSEALEPEEGGRPRLIAALAGPFAVRVLLIAQRDSRQKATRWLAGLASRPGRRLALQSGQASRR